jgi:hypothetical protein
MTHGGVVKESCFVPIGPEQLCRVSNEPTLMFCGSSVVGVPEELEFFPAAKTKPDLLLIYPTEPTRLPKELTGVQCPPKS